MFASSPIRIHPKFELRLFTHRCASATICVVDSHVTAPVKSTFFTPLTVASKSPPGLLQVAVGKNVCFQVASPGVDGPPCGPPREVPSPQSLVKRCNSTG